MYTKQEAYEIKKRFWTALGQYMSLHKSSEGSEINWLNYKTGIKDLYFRIRVDNRSATLLIELSQKSLDKQKVMYDKFLSFKDILHSYLGEEWIWNEQINDEENKIISTISTKEENVSIFRQSDWPKIISFLKTRLLALDKFWNDNREFFEGY